MPCNALVLERMDGWRVKRDRARWNISRSMQRKMSQKSETHPKGRKDMRNQNERYLLCLCMPMHLQVSKLLYCGAVVVRSFPCFSVLVYLELSVI